MTSTPTDIQKKKFEKFSKHPLKDKAVEFLNYVIAVADLDIEDLDIEDTEEIDNIEETDEVEDFGDDDSFDYNDD